MTTPSYHRRDLIQLLGTAMLGSIASPAISAAHSPTEENSPIYVPKGTGERLQIGGGTMVFKLQKAQTNGHLTVAEATLAPGFLGAPPHLHKTFDEICFVLEGSIQVLVGDRVFELKAGDLHLRPRRVMHTFWNSSSQPSRCLEFSIPGGHEEYLKDISLLLSKGVSPKPQDFAELEKKHDIVYFPDKLPEIMQKYHVHL
jgi:mannose-6-phosphate isomerase-like protein (cupin superfamily)